MQFSIIPTTEEYISGYSSCVDQVARERKYLAFLEGPALESSRVFVLQQLHCNFPHYVALHKNVVIGWCDISPFNRPVYAHAGELGMGVLAEFRGQGIGKQLLSAAIEHAKTIGLTRIELTVRDENRAAIALYEQMGFQVEGIKRHATYMDGHYSNDLLMSLVTIA